MEEINSTTKRWREVRKSANLSQPQFAEILRTTQAAISLIESGKTKNPSVDTVNKLFKAFTSLSKVWFFDGTGPMYISQGRNHVSDILQQKDILELPEHMQLDPILKEYFEKIRAYVAMQQDRIQKLENEKTNLEKDKIFLQDMIRKKQAVDY
jgi:transcriptional regulator with XRE-family HTH domain